MRREGKYPVVLQ